jgi:hypothetical protein
VAASSVAACSSIFRASAECRGLRAASRSFRRTSTRLRPRRACGWTWRHAVRSNRFSATSQGARPAAVERRHWRAPGGVLTLVARARDVAVLGADTGNDVFPLQYSSIAGPVLAIGIGAMGLWILDNPDYEQLSENVPAAGAVGIPGGHRTAQTCQRHRITGQSSDNVLKSARCVLLEGQV